MKRVVSAVAVGAAAAIVGFLLFDAAFPAASRFVEANR